MPWRVAKRGSRYCVIKEGESTPVPGGCHAARGEAVRHQSALYAGENSAEEVAMATIEPNPNTTYWLPWSTSGGTWNPEIASPILTWTDSATLASVTQVSVPEEEEEATEDLDAPTWEAVLAVEGLKTSDNRYLMPGKISHRELPLTLMAQTVTDDGHDGAFVAGKITEIWKVERPDLGEGAIAIMGSGVFSRDADGQRAQGLMEEEVLRGVSIDFAPTESYLLDPETLEQVDESEMDLFDLLGGNFVRGFEGDIMGATLCAFPAFEEATMHIVETPDKVVVASAFPIRRVLTASAAGLAPLRPPKEWFFQPEPDYPFPLTVMDDGRVMGHLALWNQCHRSMADMCEMAPRSKSGYAYFHTGAIKCDNGESVNVGRITVGDGGHASVSPYLGMKGATDHYDKTGMVGAFVRATDGRHGIWLSGAVRSDCPAEKVRDMEANPPSGDWREEKGRLELCAALSVPVAGFPVPRYEAALVASGSDERVVALVASGYVEPGALSRAGQRRIEMLKTLARKSLVTWDDGFADISAAERRRAARSGAALPDGSFPIRNCSDARNAIQAQGRTAPGNRGRVRAHIRTRVRALGCSGAPFDDYK